MNNFNHTAHNIINEMAAKYARVEGATVDARNIYFHAWGHENSAWDARVRRYFRTKGVNVATKYVKKEDGFVMIKISPAA